MSKLGLHVGIFFLSVGLTLIVCLVTAVPIANAQQSTEHDLVKALQEALRNDPPLAMAVLDRIVDGAIVLKLTGKSYRAHRAKQLSGPANAPAKPFRTK